MPDPAALRALAHIDLTEQGRLALLTRQSDALNDEADRLARQRIAYEEASRALGQAYALARTLDTDQAWRTVHERLAQFETAEADYIGPMPGRRHDDWNADARELLREQDRIRAERWSAGGGAR